MRPPILQWKVALALIGVVVAGGILGSALHSDTKLPRVWAGYTNLGAGAIHAKAVDAMEKCMSPIGRLVPFRFTGGAHSKVPMRYRKLEKCIAAADVRSGLAFLGSSYFPDRRSANVPPTQRFPGILRVLGRIDCHAEPKLRLCEPIPLNTLYKKP